jgi:GntR family transcriptional regulator
MAVEIQVNPNTVQRAYDELQREGLIDARRGKGLFVAEHGTPAAQSHAGDGVRRALDEAIRAGQAAGMTTEQVCEIFHVAMQRMTKSGSKRP